MKKFNKRFIVTVVNEDGTTKEITLYSKDQDSMRNDLDKNYPNWMCYCESSRGAL